MIQSIIMFERIKKYGILFFFTLADKTVHVTSNLLEQQQKQQQQRQSNLNKIEYFWSARIGDIWYEWRKIDTTTRDNNVNKTEQNFI